MKILNLIIGGYFLITSATSWASRLEEITPEVKDKSIIQIGDPLIFQEYSSEYFRYASTPQEFVLDIVQKENSKVLEIGAGKGEFLWALLEGGEDHNKTVNAVCVEFVEENREILRSIIKRYEGSKHSLVLSFNPDVMDYIQRNPNNKSNFFTDIVSSYSLHCLCPMDLLTLLRACHSFTQPGGQLSLTLMNWESFGDNGESVKNQLAMAQKEGDRFPGYNHDPERTRDRIQRFLESNLPYPTKYAGSKMTYPDFQIFARDIAPLLPTVHEASWTRGLLEAYGYDVVVCEDTHDMYPAHPLQEGEISNDCIETCFLKVKAIKGARPINNDLIALYEKAAREKEQQVFEIYKALVSSS